MGKKLKIFPGPDGLHALVLTEVARNTDKETCSQIYLKFIWYKAT